MAEQFLSQPALVGAILRHLDSTGIAEISVRQMNAVIAAADEIMAALADAHRPAVPGSGLAAWLRSDETGASSLYLAKALAPAAGLGPIHPSIGSAEPWPHDPADFGRCVGLLDAVPELRPHLGVLAGPEHGPAWNAMAAEWETLEAAYREDLPAGESERLYQRLRELGGRAPAVKKEGGR